MSQDEVRRTSRQLEMKNYSIANHLKELNNAIAIQSRSPAPKALVSAKQRFVIPTQFPTENPPRASEPMELRRSMRRVNSSTCNCDSDAYGEFYEAAKDQPAGRIDPHFLGDRIELAHTTLRRLGFTSAWDLILAISQEQGPPSVAAETQEFFSSNCASELMDYFGPLLPSETICDISKSVYLQEWEAVRNLDVITRNVDPSDLSSFDFANIYTSIQQSGPNLISLLDHLSNLATKSQAAERTRQRYVVMSIAQLAHRNNPGANFLQNMVGLHLYASNIPKRIYPCLNHLGVSVSDQTLRRQLTTAADVARDKILRLGGSEKAFITVFDNLNSMSKVRDMRLMNQASQINYTAGFLLCPPDERAYPTFDHTDIQFADVNTLNTAHFVPHDSDYKYIKDAMKSLVEEMIYDYAEYAKVKLPSRCFPMPVVSPIPRHPPPEVLPLPTYDLNEAEFEDMVEILYSIQEQVGASEKQCRDDRFLFAGDLLTVNNILYLLPSSLLIRQGGEVQTGRMYGAYAAQICRTNYGHISSRDDNHSAIV